MGEATRAGDPDRLIFGERFLVGDHPTIADISLYAYTHVAHEGGFDLADYPAVRAWLGSIGDLPGHAGMAGPFPHQLD